MVSFTRTSPSLRDLADDINRALVRSGHADWRRDFNARLWACSGERAMALIKEYREKLVGFSGATVSDDLIRQLFARI